MKKRIISLLFTGAAALSALAFAGMSSYAATVEEAAEVARAYGYTEDQIQQAFNEYYKNPEKYPPEVIDEVIAGIKDSGNSIVSVVPQSSSAPTATTETQTTPAEIQNPQGNEGNNGNPVVSDKITLTAPDGSTFDRISVKDFIALSYDEKMAYLSSFTEAQQQVIINNLTPEEYRSMLKQLPQEQKLEVIDKLSDAVSNLGMTMSVEDVSDDTVKVAMKNEEGTLVGVGTAGNTVENTGYDRRGILALSAMLIMTALTGIYFVTRRFFGNEAENG